MFRAIWLWRFPDRPIAGAYYWTWVVSAFFIVLFAPSRILNDLHFWRLPASGTGQALVSATAFLALSAFLARSRERNQRPRLVSALAAAAAWYGVACWYLNSRPGLLYGWSDFCLSVALGMALASLPHLLSPFYRLIGVGALLVALGFLTFQTLRQAVNNAPGKSSFVSALKPVTVDIYPSLAEPGLDNRGGAIARYGDSFLLVNGIGVFYVLTWNGDVLVSKRIALSPPATPVTSAAVQARPDRMKAYDHRITGMLVDTRSSPAQVYVAYQHWDQEGQCIDVRVSRAAVPLADAVAEGTAWTAVFRTKPCLKPSPGLDYKEAGGRLAWLGDRLLLTVADFGLAQWGPKGEPAHAQTRDTSYGKVLSIDASGQSEVFTLGHRNAQGLFVDAEQRVWLTEHGPQGGDELNLLAQGRNYGYPLVSYGTDYGRLFWSLAPGAHNHGEFEEPRHVFIPSIGISSLIRIETDLFPEWKGDLLVSSLTAERLYRVRLRGDRVIYVEPIIIGRRIRDLAEGADGRIVMWTDGGAVATLRPGPSQLDGQQVFARCRACHDSPAPTSSDLSLRNIIGRPIASVAGYPYSTSLKSMSGTWTVELLDAFLADPDTTVPGSMMGPGRVPDAGERRAVIEFLKSHN